MIIQNNFGEAIEALKNGKKVARMVWGGLDMFVYYIPSNSYPSMTEIAKETFPNGLVPYQAYLALKTTDGDVAVWTPTTSDCLAEDWIILN